MELLSQSSGGITVEPFFMNRLIIVPVSNFKDTSIHSFNFKLFGSNFEKKKEKGLMFYVGLFSCCILPIEPERA